MFAFRLSAPIVFDAEFPFCWVVVAAAVVLLVVFAAAAVALVVASYYALDQEFVTFDHHYWSTE